MSADDGRPIRPSPSGHKKDGAVPSWLRTDGKPPSRPVLSDVGRTGRLTTLRLRPRRLPTNNLPRTSSTWRYSSSSAFLNALLASSFISSWSPTSDRVINTASHPSSASESFSSCSFEGPEDAWAWSCRRLERVALLPWVLRFRSLHCRRRSRRDADLEDMMNDVCCTRVGLWCWT